MPAALKRLEALAALEGKAGARGEGEGGEGDEGEPVEEVVDTDDEEEMEGDDYYQVRGCICFHTSTHGRYSPHIIVLNRSCWIHFDVMLR